jgi:hypothetical protein
MDPRTLVNRERVEAAQTFLSKFRADGFDVQGAMWAVTEDEPQPALYLVSAEVDRQGPLQAYANLREALTTFQANLSDPFRKLDYQEFKLLSPRRPLASELLHILARYPDDQPTYHTSLNRGVPVLAAYVYPASLFAPPPVAPAPA